MVKSFETLPTRGRDDASWRIKLFKMNLREGGESSQAAELSEFGPHAGLRGPMSGPSARTVRKEDAHGTLRPTRSRV